MAASDAADAADLMSIGQHCSVASCSQIDFLPFRCDCCSRTFCLEHRTYAAHACPSSGSKVTDIIVCPICAKGIRLKPGQDANDAWEAHTGEVPGRGVDGRERGRRSSSRSSASIHTVRSLAGLFCALLRLDGILTLLSCSLISQTDC